MSDDWQDWESRYKEMEEAHEASRQRLEAASRFGAIAGLALGLLWVVGMVFIFWSANI